MGSKWNLKNRLKFVKVINNMGYASCKDVRKGDPYKLLDDKMSRDLT